MSDYKDERMKSVTFGQLHLAPHICAINGDPAHAVVSGDRIAFDTPLSRVFPLAWVSTAYAWSLTKMSSEREGQIVAEVYREPYKQLLTRTGPAKSFL